MSSLLSQTVVVFEYALVLAGLGFLAWLFFRPAGRALRRRPSALPLWDISLTEFLFLGWLVIALGFMGQIVLRIAVGHDGFTHLADGGTLELMAYGSMFDLSAVVTALVARSYLRRNRPATVADAVPAPRRRGAPVVRAGFLTFLVAMPLLTAASLVWTPVLKLAGLPTEPQALIGLFAHTRSPLVLAPMIILAIGLAPIAEEAVFRAGIFRYLRSRPPLAVLFGAAVACPVVYLGGDGLLDFVHGHQASALVPVAYAAGIVAVAWLCTLLDSVRRLLRRPTPRWVAFAVSAGLFALLHANWSSFLPLFVLGLIFAGAYEATGLIAVSMLAHALFNLNTLLLVLTGNG